MEENTQDTKSLKARLKNGISKIISNDTFEYELQVLLICFLSSVVDSLALRIVTCISSVVFFISLIIATGNGSMTQKTKSLALRIFKYIFFSIWFVFNVLLCIDNSAWGAKTVVLGLFVIILIVYFVLSFITTFFSDSLNNEKLFIVIIGLGVVSFILSEITTNYRLLLLKIAVGLFYLGFIPLYINNCFSTTKNNKKLIRILLIILKGAGIIISLPFYIRWLGLQGEDFKTFVSVYSAIVGGGLTLLGVAWTIRKTDENRKEEERKKARPIFTFNPVYERLKDVKGVKVVFDDYGKPIDKIVSVFPCVVFTQIENSECSSFSIERIYHDKEWWQTSGSKYVLPNKTVYFEFNFENNPDEIFVEIKDTLGNLYYYKISVIFLNLLSKQPVYNGQQIAHTVREYKEISFEEIKEITNNKEKTENA